MTRRSDKNAHLLVEGKNDRHVMWALCQQYKLPEVFDVLVPGQGGLDEVLQDIPIRLRESGLQALGIIVDADENLAGRWQAVRDRLVNAGYMVPEELSPGGLIVELPNRPRVGVWVMPDNQQQPGRLEDFALQLIPDGDQLLPIAETTLQTIEGRGLNLYKPVHQSKALIHTWLAWQEQPGMPMGQSITAQVLYHQADVARRFVDWLKKLFVQGA